MKTYLIEIDNDLGSILIQAEGKTGAVSLARDWVRDGVWCKDDHIWFSVGESSVLDRADPEYYRYVDGDKVSRPTEWSWHSVKVLANS